MDPMQKHATSGISLLAWMALPIVAMLAIGGGKTHGAPHSLRAGADKHAGAPGASIFIAFYASWLLWSAARVLRRLGLPVPRLVS